MVWCRLQRPAALFRGLRYLLVLGVVFFIIFCYVIPVGFVASLANLRALSRTKSVASQPAHHTASQFARIL